MAKDLLTRESLTYLLTKLKFWIESLNFVIDEDYIHTDNNYSDEDKSKLDSIPSITLDDVNNWNTDDTFIVTVDTNTLKTDKTINEVMLAVASKKSIYLMYLGIKYPISGVPGYGTSNLTYSLGPVIATLDENNKITFYNLNNAKADKASSDAEGNIAIFDNTGNPVDSEIRLESLKLQRDYSKDYLTFIAKSEGTFIFNGSVSNDITNTLSYSKDNGNTWSELAQIIEINVVPEDKILWKGETTPIANNGIGSFEGTALFDILGNMMSLLYSDDFVGKTSLYGKSYAFYKLLLTTKVIDASNLLLPATTLSYKCYHGLFYYCSLLIKVPYLPATTLANYCYQNMFKGCSSLVIVPSILPATTLAEFCYDSMFAECTSLIKTPELIATVMKYSCYLAMFYKCTSLVTPPELPATILETNCYNSMFSSCSALTKAPELIVNNLATRCYTFMFQGCTSLSYIKALFTNTPSDSYTNSWVSNVANTGIFIKSNNATWNVVGNNGVPANWQVYSEAEYELVRLYQLYDKADKDLNAVEGNIAIFNSEGNPVDSGKTFPFTYADLYLTLEALEDTTFKFISDSSVNTVQYSIDNGITWSEPSNSITVDVLAGDKVLWKGTLTPGYNRGIGRFSSVDTSNNRKKFNVEGNIMSLLYGDNFRGLSDISDKAYVFYDLFDYSYIVDASNLILPNTVSDHAYFYTFRQCSLLIKAPKFPATTLAPYCYDCTFYDCFNLEEMPELPATVLAEGCYVGMFKECSKLKGYIHLPAETLVNYCYEEMFALAGRPIIKLEVTNILTGAFLNWSSTAIVIKKDNYEGISGNNVYTESEWAVVRHYELSDYYIKPNGGIPMSDLSNDVLEAIGSGGGGEENVIEVIKVNDTELTITEKAVNISVPTKVSELNNDSGFLTEHQDISGKQDVISDLDNIRSGAALGATALQSHLDISGKLDLLVSGENIKTINNQSLLGEGNLTIRGGEGGDENIIESISVNNVSQTVDSNKNVNITVPTNTSDLTNDSGFLTEHQDISGKQDIIADLETIRSGAALGATAIQQHQDLSGKQDVISDLDTIRSGAALGATALQEHQTLKTINNLSIIGSGNITVKGGEGGGEENVIETIKVNNVELTVDSSKAVNISVPTSTSDLNNDSGFLTQHLDISGKMDKVSSSTTNAVPKFSNTTGSIQNSGVTIDSSNKLTAAAFIKSGGTSTLFLKADGSVDSSTYLTSADLSSILDRLTALENMFNITSIE